MTRSKKKHEGISIEREKSFTSFHRKSRKRVSKEPSKWDQNIVEEEIPEELPLDRAQQLYHDLIEKLEKRAQEKVKEIERDPWYEESEKEESSSYSTYAKITKKIKKISEETRGQTSKSHKEEVAKA